MKIIDIKTGTLSIPLRKAFKTALRTLEHLVTNIVLIETDDGISGLGEAPATGPITGDSSAGIRGAIHEFIKPRLIGKRIENLDEVLFLLETSCIKNTSAKAAVDIALHDLFCQMYKIPLYRFLGGFRNKVETDLTISLNSPEEMAKDSIEAISRGFRILKLKVGQDYKLDIKRIQEIRKSVGADVSLRLDANQGWKSKEAIHIMKMIEESGISIELLEQPVTAHDVEGLKQVRDSIQTPVLADESVFSPLDAEKILSMKAADFLNIKLMKTSGLRQAMTVCALAELHATECFMGCMMESKLSVTAAAHLACAKRIITRCDLDSPVLCSEDPVKGGISFEGGVITVPDLPGLGIKHIDGITWDK
ncbi:MAG: dipeptide epimerase [Candidatus Riflebacteria bacterium]|nr:dipeptide epimerase [Candidatus Riflebacteria bacterium]